MKLITEVVESVEVITEAEGDKKAYFIEGKFLQAGIPNRNHRIYPVPVLQKEVERYVRECVIPNRAYGELGHPDKPTINLERVSHMIKSLKQEGSDFIGRAKLMDTPFGTIAKNLINEGASLGVSSRGLGTLKEIKAGLMEVQDDFRLASGADIVADPSAPDAYVRGIMEGVEWDFDEKSGVWVQKIQETREDTKKELRKMSKSQLEEAKLDVFKRLLESVS